MASYVGTLSNRLYVDVTVRPGMGRGQKNATGEPSVVGRALVDTGAQMSAICEDVARKLGLISNVTEQIQGFGAEVAYFTRYWVNIDLLSNHISPDPSDLGRNVAVVASPAVDRVDRQSDMKTIALIGMDILVRCQLYVDGLDQRYILSTIRR